MTFLQQLKSLGTISNILTLSRIVLIVPLVYLVRMQEWSLAAFVFLFASITDVADGYLARLLEQQSLVGAILDPVADKLLLCSCYGTLAFSSVTLCSMPRWFFMLMVIKEILLLLGAAYMCLLKNELTIKPTILGKMAMVLQSCFMGALLVSAALGYMPVVLLWIAIGIILGCSFAAFAHYVLIALQRIYPT